VGTAVVVGCGVGVLGMAMTATVVGFVGETAVFNAAGIWATGASVGMIVCDWHPAKNKITVKRSAAFFMEA